MPYSRSLADRVRRLLGERRNLAEKKMFGGVAFLLNGNLLVCVWQSSLIARVGPDSYEQALKQSHVREFDVTGRPMRGWVMIEPDGLDADAELQTWIDASLAFVETLPPK
jgi:hypothetical protein